MLRSLTRSVLIVAAAGTLVCTSALAQPGGGGGGGGGPGGGRVEIRMGGPGGMGGMGMEPSLSSDQIKKFGDRLNFTQDQRDAAKALYDGFFAAYQEKADAFRKKMDAAREQFRETRDMSVWQEVGEGMQQLRKERQAAEATLMSDLKSLLTEEQAAQWPRIERDHRRESTIRMNMISGGSVDVAELVARLKLPEEEAAKLEPVIDAYATDLDPALSRRNAIFEQAMGQGMQMWRRMMENGGNDPEMQKMFDEGREAGIRVRDINRRYASQIKALLGPEAAAKFDEEFKRESFPQVYRQRWGLNSIAAAEKMEDLNETQRASLSSLKEGYQRDLAALQEKATKAIEEQDEKATLQGMMSRFMDDPVMRDLRTQGEALDTKTVDALKALLTPEQAAKLPERRQGGGQNWRMEGGPGMGGGGGGGENGEQPRRRRGRGNGEGEGGGAGGEQPPAKPAGEPPK